MVQLLLKMIRKARRKNKFKKKKKKIKEQKQKNTLMNLRSMEKLILCSQSKIGNLECIFTNPRTYVIY